MVFGEGMFAPRPASSEEPPVEENAAEKELSPVLAEVKSMELNFSSEEFGRAARDERRVSREVSEDAFLQIAQAILNGNPPQGNTFGALLRILERDSMRGHPKMELFKKAVQELADLTGKTLRLRENFWDDLK
jgi:hypothetical protein